MKGLVFICGSCGGEFIDEAAESEVQAEAKRNFSDEELADGGMRVCTPCYKQVIAGREANAVN